MESARKIIDAINRGVSPQELAREFPWEEILGDSSFDLLKFAQHSPDNHHSFQILAYLFRVANGNDLWFATEVLSQTVRHPILSANERKMILANLRSLLDKIYNMISVEPPTQEYLRKYWLMEGGYYTVSGASLAEEGKTENANRDYLIAQGIFEQLGLIQPGLKAGVSGAALPVASSEQPAGAAEPASARQPETVKPVESRAVLLPVQPTTENPLQAEQPAKPPGNAELGGFQPLPDVWIEDGQLHLPPVKNADGSDEIQLQAQQIEQQSEILAGIQLQIQMYLNRRSALAMEIQTLEKKRETLKTAVARLRQQAGDQGNLPL
jgi:hypothetical protein